MTKQDVFIPSVNAGEFSPKLESRIDFSKYPNGAKRLKNYNLLPHGGFRRRPGAKYVVNTKSDGQARLFPFVFNESDASIIEGGTNYFRFIRKQAQLTVPDTDASVTNGTFTSNITGWDDRSTGSGAIDHHAAGRLQLTGSAGDIAWAEQDITTSNTNEAHTIRFRVIGTIGLSVKFQVGTTSTGSELAFENGETELELGIGYHTITFTPTASPFYVQFKNDNSILGQSENILIDDVFLTDNAALELTSPYTAAQLQDVHYAQAGDVIYLAHSAVRPNRLERRGTNTWSCVEVYFEDGPWNSINEGFDIKSRQLIENPDFATGYAKWQNTSSFTAGTPTVTYDGDQNLVSFEDSFSRIEATIATGFRSGVSTWYTLHYLTVGGGDYQAGGEGTRVFAGTTTGLTDIFEIDTDGVPAGWGTHDFQTADTTPIFLTFAYGVTNGTGGVAAAFLYPQDARLIDVSGQEGSITVTLRDGSVFDTTNDVGRYIRFEYPGFEAGWGVITAVSSTTSATVQVRRKIPHQRHTESWRLGSWLILCYRVAK